jgi:hypothetical protein
MNYRLALLPGAALPIDGDPQTVTNAVPGAGSRLNLVGAAGDSLGLGITGPASAPTPSQNVTVSVYKPDGNQLVAVGCYGGGTQCAANLANLPVTGNYTVIVRPADAATGTLRLWLSRDVVRTLASGTPMALALARPGQNARLTFSGAAGALVAIQVRGVATTPSGRGCSCNCYGRTAIGTRICISPGRGKPSSRRRCRSRVYTVRRARSGGKARRPPPWTSCSIPARLAIDGRLSLRRSRHPAPVRVIRLRNGRTESRSPGSAVS